MWRSSPPSGAGFHFFTSAEICALKANSTVASSSSQGINCANAAFEVASSSRPPPMPPTKAITESIGRLREKRLSSRRNAQAPARLPGHSDTELLALATTGGTPIASRAGKEKKVPPPATEFTAPAAKAAAPMRAISKRLRPDMGRAGRGEAGSAGVVRAGARRARKWRNCRGSEPPRRCVLARAGLLRPELARILMEPHSKK